MKLVTVSEMKTIEGQADSSGLSYADMLQNAGLGLAEVIFEFADIAGWETALGLVGPGNNGGDTLVALTYLARDGWRARAYCFKRATRNDPLIEEFIEAGGEVIQAESDDEYLALDVHLAEADVILDGLLGTGLRLPLKRDYADFLAEVRASLVGSHAFVIAVDCPSGVDCDTGEAADECIPAHLTVTMAAAKQGLLRFPAFNVTGELVCAPIGLPDDLPAWKQIHRLVPDLEWVANLLPPRPPDAHKGTFGTALIAAGSVNYTGAAYLAAKAAYRVGTGLVTLAVASPLHAALAGQLPEVTWIPLPHENGFIARAGAIAVCHHLGRASALLLGPGFGMEETTRDFLAKLLEAKLPPLVVDADGLKLLSQTPDWPTHLPADTVLTPHPGEMSVLTGLSIEEIQRDREAIAAKYAKQWNCIVVLKGAFTVVAAPDGRIAVLPFASAALARAGTGDVLAGIIVGLCAQGLAGFEAAAAGAWIHARAGLAALTEVGSAASVLAGDVLDCVNDVMAELV